MKKLAPFILLILFLWACQKRDSILYVKGETPECVDTIFNSLFKAQGFENPYTTQVPNITYKYVSSWGFTDTFQLKNENGKITEHSSIISAEDSTKQEIRFTNCHTDTEVSYFISFSEKQSKNRQYWKEKEKTLKSDYFKEMMKESDDTSMCLDGAGVFFIYFDGKKRSAVSCSNCSPKYDSLIQLASEIFDIHQSPRIGE